ncbi:Dihydrolipoamide succinyltransferase component (E2) of 2-oxoglutarate dehydrogenase complex [Arcticibacter svalbardensis MN12-7]|uniref:Dihydrolipoyllysine-residue succinyltransferase component of 2-oxoglutarate dehydrogenase complex n=1 Tax=Arcticibacter svalbardensis MN12-7 TaxID=1150600 RepID=R9GNH6_9SPHI|nr:2-oxoglutarate dehydrogenase complex dihydrolipoyllysine-residue succinyltransferase [Arcticibacter svalbardensis]EOR93268.1 Dihydrolipoamide succinyltransferase component (E2) of 2-oxoglutarate dehydrogenase complex [Arcticibacter svalbardensis MN12-7]
MSLEIKVPPVGESISEVTLSQWKKKDGDYVEMDEVIAELESDKATFELTASVAGTLKITAAEGDTLEIGAVVCSIEEGAGSQAPEASAAPAPAEVTASADQAESSSKPESTDSAKTLEIKVPPVGESITEVTLSKWLVKDGESVEMDQQIAELESDKATFELTAEIAGIVKQIAEEGATLAIGAVVCAITSGAAGSSSPKPETAKEQATADKSPNYASGTPSPSAGKILSEKGVDPASVAGTGVAGRITKEDAVNAQKSVPQPGVKKPEPVAAPAVVVSGSRNERRVKMTSLRKTIAKRLIAVKSETAMLTTFNEVDMKPVMDLRTKYKDKFKEKHGVGLGFMSFFTKAVSEALKEFPSVNARIENDEIVYSDFADVSIAVSAPKGLVVPVIRNADAMSLAEIEKSVLGLALKARDNKLTIEEMTGGTFTITNGGIFGSMMSTPIINAPQSAILGMHNIVERPIALNGEVVIRPIMYIALSYDHRIIDGKESVSFLVRVKQLLEDPARLLLGV